MANGVKRRGAVLASLALGAWSWAAPSYGQEAEAVPAVPPPAAAPAAPAEAEAEAAVATPAEAPAGSVADSEILSELRRLRSEVAEARQLKSQVESLQQQLDAAHAAGGAEAYDFTAPYMQGAAEAAAPPPPRLSTDLDPDEVEKADPQVHGLRARFRFHHDGTGPKGGGAYFSLSTADDEYSLNFAQVYSIDSTNFDRGNLPTIEQGFNLPFQRLFFYGNVTKDFSYQLGIEGTLGNFNMMDAYMMWHIRPNVSLRLGRGLLPVGYEYYAFMPTLTPAIADSAMFPLEARRGIGAMFTGTLLDNRIQWWSGLANSPAGTYGALNRNVSYYGSFTTTPFRGDAWHGSLLEGLGGGVDISAGQNNYALNQPTSSNTLNNTDLSLNNNFITQVGVPWYIYNDNMRASGEEARMAEHLFWYGRFSFLGEMINYSRQLTNGVNSGRSTQWGYMLMGSYWLTGERDFMGNGFQGYTVMEPLRPFIPSRGEYGPGAWQIAAQWNEINAGRGDMQRGFVDLAKSTNRMESFDAGVNWWPNAYTRFSFHYVWTWFNNPIPVQSPGSGAIDRYQTFWFRWALFF